MRLVGLLLPKGSVAFRFGSKYIVRCLVQKELKENVRSNIIGAMAAAGNIAVPLSVANG